MEESKTLVEQLREMVEISTESNQYPTVHADAILGHLCVSKSDERELFTTIADRIEQEYLPRPRFEDGEPVQFGDDVVAFESPLKVDSVTFCSNGRVFIGDLIDFDELEATGEVLKRPETEVLDADGVPIHVGDTVWTVYSGEKEKVVEILPGKRISIESGGWRRNVVLTHNQPDTLERIEADAVKSFNDYWGCGDVECHCCPVTVDGKKPWERYECNGNCAAAQMLDLLRRQREVLERGQR